MTTSFWQFKAHDFVPYQNELAADNKAREGIAGPADDEVLGTLALKDWNRFKDTYYINGTSVAELHPEDFASVKSLKAFFRMHLLQDMRLDSDGKEILLNQCLRHFHQQGIPHATAMALIGRDSKLYLATITENANARYDGINAQPENIRIDFTTTETGIAVRETNEYRTVLSRMEDDVAGFPASEGQYCAKTVTDSEMSLDGRITIKDVAIDCKRPSLKKIFDQRTLWEKVSSFFQSLMGNNEVAALPTRPSI